jgi:hypothetical protein
MIMIRSQDKETLMPIGTLEIGYLTYPHIDNTFGDIGKTIGKYKSKLRCFEILDEIQKEFQYRYHDGVYQMPEK